MRKIYFLSIAISIGIFLSTEKARADADVWLCNNGSTSISYVRFLTSFKLFNSGSKVDGPYQIYPEECQTINQSGRGLNYKIWGAVAVAFFEKDEQGNVGNPIYKLGGIGLGSRKWAPASLCVDPKWFIEADEIVGDKGNCSSGFRADVSFAVRPRDQQVVLNFSPIKKQHVELWAQAKIDEPVEEVIKPDIAKRATDKSGIIQKLFISISVFSIFFTIKKLVYDRYLWRYGFLRQFRKEVFRKCVIACFKYRRRNLVALLHLPLIFAWISPATLGRSSLFTYSFELFFLSLLFGSLLSFAGAFIAASDALAFNLPHLRKIYRYPISTLMAVFSTTLFFYGGYFIMSWHV